MKTMLQVPGVQLEVYKEDRRLTPEKDGYLGHLWSGSVVILAVIDPAADHTIGLFRDGSDHYVEQKDLLNNPKTASQQKCHERYLAGRKFPGGTCVYGVKVPLRVDEAQAINTVHYPENMLMLAQFTMNGQRRGSVRIWKVALVSQDGQFFLTAQCAYETKACRSVSSKIVLPRFRAHRQLEQLLACQIPSDTELSSEKEFRRPAALVTKGLKGHEGIVERWYDARNMGCIITSRGAVRAHWREVPPRPRRRRR